MSAFYGLVRAASIPAFRLYFGLRADGSEHVPATGPVILAGNHVSYLDPAVLGSTCRRPIHFLMDARIYWQRGMTWFFRGMEALPVDRERPQRETIRNALRLLDAGMAVGIFPEGRRTVVGEEASPLGGVALLARRSGAPVIPVGIDGTDVSMPKGASLPSPARVRVRFGEPLVHADVLAAADDARGGDALFTERLMERVAALVSGTLAKDVA